MKKKGLIVATIVMVLVLAVSLTTATYAWFTAANVTTVEKIAFSVGTGSDVSIGLKINNTYQEEPSPGQFTSGTTPIGSAFATDAVVNGAIPGLDSTYWEGEPGLGSSIDMQLDLQNMQKAVGTGKIGVSAGALDLSTLRTAATADANGVVMASGNGINATTGTIVSAYAQRDYLDVVIGVKASANDLNSITCNVTINPTQGIDLGMNAAIHVAWEIDGDITDNSDGNPDGNVDAYGENHRTAVRTTLAKTLVGGNTTTNVYGGTGQTLNDGAVNIPITIVDLEEGQKISTEVIYQIHLVIWIDGTDSDCVNQALGVGSEIYINFSAEAPGRPPQA